MDTFKCPRCKKHFEPEENIGSEDKITCPYCFLSIKVAKIFWINKGVKIDSKKELRCPHCNALFCEGEYPDKELTFKCKQCKKFSTFIRIT